MEKKILFYNWDPLAGPAGGGVTEYLMELVSQLVNDTDYKIWFLNAGRKYTADCRTCLKKKDNPFGNRVQSYEIVNSPIFSPGRQSIVNIRRYLEDEIVYELCKELIIKAGGVDIIHYHNLEGLSLKVLTLKRDFPNTKFIYSFHNYFPVCTQVNLWKDDKGNCKTTDFKQCGNCYRKENYDLTRFRFQHIDIPMLKDIFLQYSDAHPDRDNLNIYREFREKNILYFNQYMDTLLAVSQRTREILIQCGLDDKKTQVMYTGSNIAQYQGIYERIRSKDGILRIVYLGYMRRDKGFYFFLDTMREMDEEMARHLAVTIIARHTDQDITEKQRLMSMREKFYNITLYNGFRDYEELGKILSQQELGIVPVLWEDNLPRVAMEQVAFGLPVLSSDLGGASELGNRNPDFVFKAGDKGSFLYKLEMFLRNKEKLDEYWLDSMKLITMEEHLKQLKEIYSMC